MTKMDWMINIDNSASIVADAFGNDVVASVFGKYGATCSDNLNPRYTRTSLYGLTRVM